MAPLIDGFHPGYERRGIYTPEEVFAHLGNGWAVFDGDVVAVTSLRYYVFKRSMYCVTCGIEGVYFAKERSAKKVKPKPGFIGPQLLFKSTSGGWHFNLYATLPSGEDIMMTKDHVMPRCKGGEDHLDNLETMCRPCNCKKADMSFLQPVLPFGTEIISL